MKKQIITLSLAAAVAIGFTGCFGGGSLTTPVKERAQNVDATVMLDVKGKASKAFTKGLEQSKYTNKQTVSLGDLKASNEKLYNLILPIAQESMKMYKERALPEDILANSASWLTTDINTLNVTTVTTKSGKFNGRFSPFNDLLLINYTDSVDENLAKFLVAHEFGHAVALHVSEEKTMQKQILDGAADAAGIATEVVLNEAYLKLQAEDKKITDLIDLAVNEKVYANFFDEKDLENEKKIVKARGEGFAAKAAIKAGKKEALTKMGIDLTIPLKTKMVLKYLVNQGLDATGAIDALKGGVDFASANAIAITGHGKDQEMEADSIALELNTRLGIDTKAAACKIFADDKEAGIFDAHPSYKDRRANLGCK